MNSDCDAWNACAIRGENTTSSMSSQQLGAWQFGAMAQAGMVSAMQFGVDAEQQTDFIPSPLSLGVEQWQDPASSRAAAPHWLFTAAWAGVVQDTTGTAAVVDGAEDDWTISTASMTQENLSSAENNGQDGPGSSAACNCSDPVVCNAQGLVAAAAASATPGVHAPVADSAALLNSGAVLLFGQGSTTMHGTNTAQGAGASAGSGMFSPDSCRSHVLSSSQHAEQEHTTAHAPSQHAVRTLGVSGAGRRRTGSRRRQGLLVDSQAGMQQLVAASVGAPQHAVEDPCALQDKPRASALPDEELPQQRQHQGQLMQQHQGQDQLQQCSQGTAVLAHAPHVLSSLQGLSVRPTPSEGHSHSVPASGDVLVLGLACNSGEAGEAPAPAAATPTKAAAAAGGPAPGSAQRAGAEQHAPTAAQPVLQLLSCSSLNSNPPAGRSNSSLFHVSFSNCSFLRLGSFTGTHSFASTHTISFSSQDASFTQGRPGSFSGQQAGAAAGDPALPSPGRPSPLPMLHESCSWGKNLDSADRQAARSAAAGEQRHGAHGRRQHPAAEEGQQQMPHKQPQQLIYLLD
jgi:hypothetical protein